MTMTEHDAAQADETTETTEQADSGVAGAVDDRAAQLMGSGGAAATDAPVADNSGAVAQAEEHLEDTNLADDRETLKKLQKSM
jgi:hypothetical protein